MNDKIWLIKVLNFVRFMSIIWTQSNAGGERELGFCQTDEENMAKFSTIVGLYTGGGGLIHGRSFVLV